MVCTGPSRRSRGGPARPRDMILNHWINVRPPQDVVISNTIDVGDHNQPPATRYKSRTSSSTSTTATQSTTTTRSTSGFSAAATSSLSSAATSSVKTSATILSTSSQRGVVKIANQMLSPATSPSATSTTTWSSEQQQQQQTDSSSISTNTGASSSSTELIFDLDNSGDDSTFPLDDTFESSSYETLEKVDSSTILDTFETTLSEHEGASETGWDYTMSPADFDEFESTVSSGELTGSVGINGDVSSPTDVADGGGDDYEILERDESQVVFNTALSDDQAEPKDLSQSTITIYPSSPPSAMSTPLSSSSTRPSVPASMSPSTGSYLDKFLPKNYQTFFDAGRSGELTRRRDQSDSVVPTTVSAASTTAADPAVPPTELQTADKRIGG